ncbi:MAG: TIR domain-containing protein [Clostridiales bacterium]|jgi:tetratricopeptide (TPR) repeat protein|nr:TIR domain-containing protein [Clostridiales bacterium]
MAAFKCKNCGGNITADEGAGFGTCEYCGVTSTLPKVSDDRLVNMFNRANHFRRLNDFDKALAAYEAILNEDDASAEAHWCVALCRYGIEYVEDPVTRNRVPTCHRTQYEPILADPDYLAALEHSADSYIKGLYVSEAERINEIQKNILKISGREEPFDVFICYKEADGGNRTKDSVLAQEIYYQLAEAGYRVFFARITLEDKLGHEYEPYIFSALNSAKVMLVVGTGREHLEAVWVKNEWSRYLALMKKDRSRLLIPCYRDMDAYDLPDELANLQALDASKVGFLQDLVRGIKKVLDTSPVTEAKPAAKESGAAAAAPGVESLYQRVLIFLEDGDWKQADEYCERILDIDPKHAPAYVGKLCAELRVRKEDDLLGQDKPFDENPHYQKALKFADPGYIDRFKAFNADIKDRIKKENERLAKQERIKAEQERIEKGRRDEKERKEREERIARLKPIREKLLPYKGLIHSISHTVGLRTDGTVAAAGYNRCGRCNVADWNGIVAIAAGGLHTVGLRYDGTVVAVGYNNEGQCNTQSWRDIIAISTADNNTVGLRKDGTVVAVGRHNIGEFDLSEWRDITSVSTSPWYTVGIRENGTVAIAGDVKNKARITDNWRDIVAVHCSYSYLIGLKADGTVLSFMPYRGEEAKDIASDLRDIVAITSNGVFGALKSDGTVWINTLPDYTHRYTRLKDIVVIPSSCSHIYGIKFDGTVITDGHNHKRKRNVSHWSDIVAVATSDSRTIGLKSDGTVLVAGGYSKKHNKDFSKWSDIGPVSEAKMLERIKNTDKWISQGLCRYCGGELRGVFRKKCKSCGRRAKKNKGNTYSPKNIH